MRRMSSLIALLVLALFVQNTCPHGFAGKTSVAKTCDQCAFKEQHLAAASGEHSLFADPSPVHFPLFVFSLPMSAPAFQPGPAAVAEPVIGEPYTDAAPAELLRPPRA